MRSDSSDTKNLNNDVERTMDDDRRVARSSILSNIRNLHRHNAEMRKSAQARASNRNTLESQRQREQTTIRFTEVYEAELNAALDVVEKAFAEVSVQDRGEPEVGEPKTPVVRLGR